MKMTKKVKALIAEFAVIHREIRVIKYADFNYNLDAIIAYRCADLINQVKHSPHHIEALQDEVAYERECLAKIKAQK